MNRRNRACPSSARRWGRSAFGIGTAALLSIAGVTTSAKGQTIAGPITRGDSSYYLTQPMGWHDAQAVAVSLGGHLATVNDAAEQAWLLQEFASHPLLWIGLHDTDQNGSWVWVSGQSPDYTAWGCQQPGCCGGIYEDAALTHPQVMCDASAGLWHDAAAGTQAPGVVEVPCTSGPPITMVNWTRPLGGVFSDEDNWQGSNVPTAEQGARFDLDAPYWVFLGGDTTLARLVVETDNITFSLASQGVFPHALQLRHPPCTGPSLRLAPEAANTALMTVLHGPLDFDGDIVLGQEGPSTSRLTIGEGASLLSNDGASRVRLGMHAGADATLAIFGGGGLSGGARVSVPYLSVGDVEDSTGTFTITGGFENAVVTIGQVVLGDFGDGSMEISGGAEVAIRNLTLGRSHPHGDGTISLWGADSSFSIQDGGSIMIGKDGEGAITLENGAVIEMSGGSSTITLGGGINTDPAATNRAVGDLTIRGTGSELRGGSATELVVAPTAFGRGDVTIGGTVFGQAGARAQFGTVSIGRPLVGTTSGGKADFTVTGLFSIVDQTMLINGDACSIAGTIVGNAQGSAEMTVNHGATYNATSFLITAPHRTFDEMGVPDEEESVTISGVGSQLNCSRDLTLSGDGWLRIAGGAFVQCQNGRIGCGGEPGTARVRVAGAGTLWDITGTLTIGVPGNPDAEGELIFSASPDGAQVRADRLRLGEGGVITNGTAINPTVHVGTVRSIPDIQCSTLLFDDTPTIDGVDVVFGVGAGIGGFGTWPGDFQSIGGEVVVPSNLFNCSNWHLPRRFTIDGDYSQDGTGRLSVQMIGALCACGEYENSQTTSLQVNGVATLTGGLSVAYWDQQNDGLENCEGCCSQVRPESLFGQTFEILTAESVVGEFASVSLDSRMPTNRVDCVYEPTRVLVTVLPPVCDTTITSQPQGGLAAPGATIAFDIGATTEWQDVVYEWQAFILEDSFYWWAPAEPGGPGSSVGHPFGGPLFSSVGQGTGELVVTIDQNYFANLGDPNLRIRCIIRDACGGEIISSEAIVTICRADFDHSGAVSVPDIFAFLAAWFGQVPAADFDGNGQIQVPDIFAFLSAWFAGCQ